MPRSETLYVRLFYRWVSTGSGRWTHAAGVSNDPDTPRVPAAQEEIALFEVEGCDKGSAVATVAAWMAKGQPTGLRVRRLR